MDRRTLRTIIVLAIFLVGFWLASCSDSTSESNSNPSKFKICLIDAPANYDAVYIDIEDVQVNYSNDDAGWASLENVRKGVVNILDLSCGSELLIAEGMAKEGFLSEIRLMLGADNTVVVDGVSHMLSTPSAQQSGLKLKINKSISSGQLHQLIVDFDANKSIVKAGNSGKYNLKPVLRVFTDETAGAISGIVQPIDVMSSVTAISNVTKEEFGTVTNEFGEYFICGLNDGSYNLMIEPAEDSGYLEALIEDVQVVDASVTSVETVTLSN